jgi:tetratricopeptide (TPR) repeat protein
MPEYALALGEANLQRDKKEAIIWFTRFLEEDGSEKAFQRVASIYSSSGMFEEAARTYEEGRKRLQNELLFAKEIVLLHRQSDPTRYLQESVKLYSTVPGDRVWVERMLKQEVERGNRTGVLGAIREELRSHNDRKELHLLLGDILVELNDFEGALAEYRLSEETTALLLLAKECQEEEKYELALTSYQDYIEKTPGSIEAHVGMGDCYAAMGDFDGAEEYYQRAVAMSKEEDRVAVLYRLGEIHVLKGDFDNARAHYRNIEENYPSLAGEAIFRIADSYMKEGEFEKAEAKCNEALAYDKPRSHFLLGEIHYYRGDFPTAKEHYQKVTFHDPRSRWLNDCMERLVLLAESSDELKAYAEAEALLLQNRYDESIEVSKELLKDAPSSQISPHATFLLAEVYERKGKPAVAIEGYRDVIDNYPESHLCPRAQHRIGLLYLTQLKDPENAKRELETVLLKYPDSVIAEEVRNELRSLP